MIQVYVFFPCSSLESPLHVPSYSVIPKLREVSYFLTRVFVFTNQDPLNTADPGSPP